MTVTKEQLDQLLEVSKPLIKWMNDNCNPHCSAHVDQNSVELSVGVARNITNDYLKG